MDQFDFREDAEPKSFPDVRGIHDRSFEERRNMTFSDWRSKNEKLAFMEVQAIIDFIESRYSVSITVVKKEIKENAAMGQVTYCHKPFTNFVQQLPRLRSLKEQFIKIPPRFFNTLGIKEVVVAREIFEIHNATGTKNQLVGTEVGLYAEKLNVTSGSALFHELFHLLDAQHGGLEVMESQSWEEYEEAALKNDAWNQLEPNAPLRKDNEYSDEEQAGYCRMIFNLNDPHDRQKLYEPFMKDPGKRAKIVQMKKWLKDWSNGQIDDRFWEDLEAGKVDDQYWKNREKN